MWMIIAAVIVVGAAFLLAQYRYALSAKTQYSAPLISASPVDGTSTILADADWQKVLVGADPAAAGQGSLAAGTSSAGSTSLSTTDKLGRALFTQYVQLEQAGAANDPNSINGAVSQILSDNSIFQSPKQYLISDLTIGNDKSSDALRIYANAIAILFQTHDADQGKEIDLATEAISPGK